MGDRIAKEPNKGSEATQRLSITEDRISKLQMQRMGGVTRAQGPWWKMKS